jgi:uncharacterized membrane protein YeaQ/YmgE (transglycosylase-associated protein family)
MLVVGALLHPGNVLAWILVGLLAGALAGMLTRGRGFGCLGDIIVGLIGAFLGGLIVSPFVKPTHTFGFWTTVLLAVIGAVVLILGLRAVRTIL